MIRVIDQEYEIWGECPTDHTEILKLIERVGRICWQSYKKQTPTSYLDFVNMLADMRHGAMIEHSNMVIAVSCRQTALDESPYIKCGIYEGNLLYAGNLRAFMEAMGYAHPMSVLEVLAPKQITDPDRIPLWAKRFTVKLVTDRTVTHEFVRHRPASYAQLSQRYVDHRSIMEFILPAHYVGRRNSAQYDVWYKAMEAAAEYYTQLREYGEQPQQARKVLPNSIRTDIAVTADSAEWQHIFGLRVSPKADPQINSLLAPVKADFINLGWIQPDLTLH